MGLLELLNKRKNNEDLTEEELATLKEYDESLKVHMSTIEALKTEKEALDAKMKNMDSELQNKSRILSDKEAEAKRLADEKAQLEEIYNNAKSTEEAKLEIERQKAERDRIKAKEKLEFEKAEAKRKAEEEKAEIEKQVKEMQRELAMSRFERKVMAEKAKRPYLEKQLDKILANVEAKGIETSEIALEVLLEAFNHEEEMEKLKNKDAGSIFDKKKVKIVEETQKKGTTEDEVLAFAKKAGFRIRNTK